MITKNLFAFNAKTYAVLRERMDFKALTFCYLGRLGSSEHQTSTGLDQ